MKFATTLALLAAMGYAEQDVKMTAALSPMEALTKKVMDRKVQRVNNLKQKRT